MQLEIVYEKRYDYWKESYGQGSTQTNTSFAQYVPWDGHESVEKLLRDHNADFIADAKRKEDGDSNHRFIVSGLRIGGPKSPIIVRLEKVIIPALDGELESV